MEKLQVILDYMQLFGLPTITIIAGWCVSHCVKITKHIVILQRAQKAQMRAQLFKDYEFYNKQGYIPQKELDEWMNQYKAYHELVGENEVLDARKDVLKKMSTTPTN